MTQDHGWFLESGRAMVNIVQIGMAQATGSYFYQHLPRPGRGSMHFFYPQGLVGLIKHCRFHFFAPPLFRLTFRQSTR